MSFPVWAFATDETAGSSVDGGLPCRLPGPGRVWLDPGRRRRTRPGGRSSDRARSTSRSPSSRSSSATGRAPTRADRSIAPAGGTARAADDPVVARRSGVGQRVGGLVERALPVLGDQIGLPWHANRRWSSRRRSAGRPVAMPACSTRRPGGSRWRTTPSDFVVLHESAHGWFNGGLLADRWANEAFASYYGLPAAAALKVKAAATKLTAALEKATDPAQRLGRGRARNDRHRGLRVRGQPGARQGGRGSRRRGRAPGGLGRRGRRGSGRTSRRPSRHRPGAETRRRPAGLARPARPARRHGPGSFDDLWRTWVARPEDLPLLDARHAARTRYDAVVAAGRRLAAAGAHPGGAARVAVRGRHRAARSRDAACSTSGPRSRRRAAAAGLHATAGALHGASRGPTGSPSAADEADAELETIDRYAGRGRHATGRPDMLLTLGLWGETPDADLAASRTRSRAGDLSAAAAAAAAAAPPTWSGAADLGRGPCRQPAGAGAGRCSWPSSSVGRRRLPRSAQHAAGPARARAAARPCAEEPYATLAATPDGTAGRCTSATTEEPIRTDGPARATVARDPVRRLGRRLLRPRRDASSPARASTRS